MASAAAEVQAIAALANLNHAITTTTASITLATTSIPQASSSIARSSITSAASKHIAKVPAGDLGQIIIGITILTTIKGTIAASKRVIMAIGGNYLAVIGAS
jgi:hypothetical protein